MGKYKNEYIWFKKKLNCEYKYIRVDKKKEKTNTNSHIQTGIANMNTTFHHTLNGS